MTKEIWLDIPGYVGRYRASNLGRIEALTREIPGHPFKLVRKGKILKPCNNGRGYYYVRLCNGTQQPVVYVHRIIAALFVPNPRQRKQVDHVNRDSSDNRAINLRWCSASENQKNKSTIVNHTSRYNGVSWTRWGWRCAIFVSGKSIHLGLHKTEKDAARVFDKFCIENNLDRKLNFA